MSEHNSLVATFANRNVAEATLRRLRNSGLDNAHLSIVSRDRERIARDVEGAMVFAALDELGPEQSGCIPPDNVLDYEAELNAGRVIAVLHGSPEEIAQARDIIDLAHPESWSGNVGCSVFYGCYD